VGCTIAKKRREAKYNEVSEQRAEKERQEREAKKAAGELLTGDMVSWKRERGNLTEREVAAMAASKHGAKTKDGKRVKVAKKMDIKKRSAKVAPTPSGSATTGSTSANSEPSASKKASNTHAKALWAKVGSDGRVTAKVELAIPKGPQARKGKSKYRHAVRQTAEQREDRDEVEEELKRRGTRMTSS